MVPRSFRDFKAATERSSSWGRANKKHLTKPEVILRRALRRAGLRTRVYEDLPGVPDIVLPDFRAAIFVDGDFWHGRSWKSRRQRLIRGTNAEYWVEKIRRNRLRDRRVSRQLRNRGWSVIRVWESTVCRDVVGVANLICAYAAERRPYVRLRSQRKLQSLLPQAR